MLRRILVVGILATSISAVTALTIYRKKKTTKQISRRLYNLTRHQILDRHETEIFRHGKGKGSSDNSKDVI
jgi:hypothetical protein